MQRLTSSDASFLYTESASGPMHISSLMVVEGEMDFDIVFQHLEARVPKVPSYRRKLAQTPMNVAHPAWVDDNAFDLRNHVIEHRVPEGTDLDGAIAIGVALNEKILDRSHPLWKMIVITGVPDRTLLLMMTHHAMIDGASGVELMAIVFDLDANFVPETPDTNWQPEPEPSPVELFNTAMAENLSKLRGSNPLALFTNSENTRKVLNRAWRLAGNFLSRPAITAPFNAGMVGPKRKLGWMMEPLGDVRDIRRALGGTVNDVALTVVTEGVARYLADHGEEVDEGLMRLMCPVNVRTEDGKGALGNQVSGIFPMLPAWPMPVAQRMATVVGELERIKSAGEAQALTLIQQSAPEPWPVALWPTQLVGTRWDPTALAAQFPQPVPTQSTRPPNFGVNFVCTNVPGPQVPLYLCGHQVLDQLGLLVLTGNLGLGITIYSYNRKLYFCLISETNLLPDVDVIVGHCQDAFNELRSAAQERAAQLAS